jgi:hypothetical protein
MTEGKAFYILKTAAEAFVKFRKKAGWGRTACILQMTEDVSGMENGARIHPFAHYIKNKQ